MSTLRDLLYETQVSDDTDSKVDTRLITITDQAITVVEKLLQSKESLENALQPGVGIGVAIKNAMQSVSALLSAASVKCNLKAPPAEIEMKVNSDDRLIYRCSHSPAHEWDLTGRPL
jgi:hypothetical protein